MADVEIRQFDSQLWIRLSQLLASRSTSVVARAKQTREEDSERRLASTVRPGNRPGAGLRVRDETLGKPMQRLYSCEVIAVLQGASKVLFQVDGASESRRDIKELIDWNHRCAHLVLLDAK